MDSLFWFLIFFVVPSALLVTALIVGRRRGWIQYRRDNPPVPLHRNLFYLTTQEKNLMTDNLEVVEFTPRYTKPLQAVFWDGENEAQAEKIIAWADSLGGAIEWVEEVRNAHTALERVERNLAIVNQDVPEDSAQRHNHWTTGRWFVYDANAALRRNRFRMIEWSYLVANYDPLPTWEKGWLEGDQTDGL